jgi:hypothetical protein
MPYAARSPWANRRYPSWQASGIGRMAQGAQPILREDGTLIRVIREHWPRRARASPSLARFNRKGRPRLSGTAPSIGRA